MEKPQIQVGTVVRVSRSPSDNPHHSRGLKTGRALVATLEEDLVCVLLEDAAPVPIKLARDNNDNDGTRKRRRLNRTFLVAPFFRSAENTRQDVESIVPTNGVSALLDFEVQSELQLTTASEWKERGDQILRLGDVTVAAAFYEEGLAVSSALEVGGSALLQKNGRAVAVDIDCINDEDGTVDVTFMTDTGEEEEMVVKESHLLLCIDDKNPSLQQRIILNLSRCLMQLADLDNDKNHTQNRPFEYYKGAVLACTLVLAIAAAEDDAPRTSTTLGLKETALLLRSRAQARRGKWQHAISDAKRLLQINPLHEEGEKLLQQVERQRKRQQQTDKKLSKAVCRWVEKATKEEGNAVDDGRNTAVSLTEKDARQAEDSISLQFLELNHLSHFFVPLIGVWLLFIFYRNQESLQDDDVQYTT